VVGGRTAETGAKGARRRGVPGLRPVQLQGQRSLVRGFPHANRSRPKGRGAQRGSVFFSSQKPSPGPWATAPVRDGHGQRSSPAITGGDPRERMPLEVAGQLLGGCRLAHGWRHAVAAWGLRWPEPEQGGRGPNQISPILTYPRRISRNPLLGQPLCKDRIRRWPGGCGDA